MKAETFADPERSEAADQNADRELQRVLRHARQRPAKGQGGERHHDGGSDGSQARVAPSPHRAYREDDGHRLDALDERSQERRGHRRAGVNPVDHCASSLSDGSLLFVHPHATRRATMQQIHCHHMEMHQMNWRAFDLNLLVVFDGLFREGSVTRAGKRLGMSQPALSHALNRLRYLLKDQLFIRTPGGMVPTPRAEQLARPLRHALAQMEPALEPETFVAAQTNRRFSIAINNYAAIVMAAPLVGAVSAAAPLVQLDLRPSGTLDIFDRLDRGELDLGI